jgi:HEAT repeat protein
MLNQAFDALKGYDWGADSQPLKPIDEAVVTTHGDAAGRQDLESRLIATLKSDISRDAKDYICRKLMVMGTTASIPVLIDLLAQPDHSHMARFALERIQAPEAATALRESLPKLPPALKIGVLSSLGTRRDAASVRAIGALLTDADQKVIVAAALALGAIQTPEAAELLKKARPTSDEAKRAVTDASLACAEALLAAGKKTDALSIYKSFAGPDQAKHVRLAATRGMLACASK